MTVRAGEIELTAFGPIELSAFLIPRLGTRIRVVDGHFLAVELRLVVGNKSSHLAALHIFNDLFAIGFEASVDITFYRTKIA